MGSYSTKLVIIMTDEKNIKRTMTLGDLVQEYPKAVPVLTKAGLHCIGCHVATWETIEQGCKAHGLSDGDIDKILDEMNEIIKE